MIATELTESTERGVWGGKSISVFSVLSVAESYKKQIQFSIHDEKNITFLFCPEGAFLMFKKKICFQNIPAEYKIKLKYEK